MVVLVGLAIGTMAHFLAVPAFAGDQVNKRTGSIDVASIVNFMSPALSPALNWSGQPPRPEQ